MLGFHQWAIGKAGALQIVVAKIKAVPKAAHTAADGDLGIDSAVTAARSIRGPIGPSVLNGHAVVIAMIATSAEGRPAAQRPVPLKPIGAVHSMRLKLPAQDRKELVEVTT